MFVRIFELKQTEDETMVSVRGSIHPKGEGFTPSVWVPMPVAEASRLKLGSILKVDVREATPEELA